MKINDQNPILRPEPTRPSGPNARPAADEPATSGAGAPAAKVELSSRSRELHEALRAASETPDVRREEVERVREELREGRYQIDPERIARGMLDRRA